MTARGRTLRQAAVLTAVMTWAAEAAAQPDPRLRWQTIETPHFRVHFYQDTEAVARRVARIMERVADRLAAPLGWRQQQRTEVVLTDDSDDANGSATALPFNTVRLFLSAPDDLSVLQQYDDWLTSLATHEYTHILHVDNIHGVPALVNAVVGRQWSPNQVQPRFILEGLATYEESLHTRGGRMRSSMWEMYLRADALSQQLLTLDQVANGPNRWPHGNLWYLYGSYLMQFAAARHGAQSLASLSREYGAMTIPWQLNRAARRVWGETWEDLYDAFAVATRARFEAQRDAIAAEGLTSARRLTHQGEVVRAPRFLSDGTLLYESNDGQSQTQLRALAPGADAPRDVGWLGSPSAFGVVDDSTLIVSDVAPHRDIYLYHDLYRWRLERGGRATPELATRERLTHGERAQQPDVSPDGDHVVYTSNHRGTTALFERSLARPEEAPHCLFRPLRFEQVYAPRYSPDGQTIAFSWWRRGGRRDIALYHRDTGQIERVTDDVVLDLSPTFSPDGRYLVWSSDRTGVNNLYARDLVEGVTRQVTNVVDGAFQPVVSPDQRRLVFVGYGPRGFDLFEMPFDPARFREPAAVIVDPLGRDVEDPHHDDLVDVDDTRLPFEHRVGPYSPWPTLYPRSWLAELGSDGFGPQLALRLGGADVVGRHSWSARLALGLARFDPGFDVTYSFAGVRPTLRMRAYRSVEAGSGYRLGGRETPWAAERWGGESELSVTYPALFERSTFALSYEAQWVRALGGFPGLERGIDPNEVPPGIPQTGWTTGLRMSWFYGRVQRFAYSISAQQGVNGFVSVRVNDPIFGGTSQGTVDVSGGVNAYIPMPFARDRRRHVLALHLGAGIAATDRGERGLYALGGFPQLTVQSLLDAFRYGAQAGGVALRGYPAYARVGSQYQLFNAEYRFPVWQVQRGPSTLPVFVQRVSGDAFVDVGHAGYGPFNPDNLAVGAGAELLIDVVLGYILPFTFRVGYARGFSKGGGDQGYALFSSPF